jgi:2-hydroxy-3-keto-5-methylthiopentenyl-1-phosphate phosphatase
MRGEFYRLRQAQFVEAAKAFGVPSYTIIFKHIVPNGFNSVDWLGDLIRILDIDVREITELMNGNDDAETVEERIQNLIKWGSEHDIEFI